MREIVLRQVRVTSIDLRQALETAAAPRLRNPSHPQLPMLSQPMEPLRPVEMPC